MKPTKPGLYEVKIGVVRYFIEFDGERWYCTNGSRVWPADDAELRGPFVVEGEADTFRRQIAKTQYLDESAGWPEIVSKLVMGAPATAEVLIDWEAITSTIGRHTARYALEARYPTLGSLPVKGEREIYVGPCDLPVGVYLLREDGGMETSIFTRKKYPLSEGWRAICVGDVPEFPPAPPPETVMPEGPPPRRFIARNLTEAHYGFTDDGSFVIQGGRSYASEEHMKTAGWQIEWLDKQEPSDE